MNRLYRKYKDPFTEETSTDGILEVHIPSGKVIRWIPSDELNGEYQRYLKWLDEGNTPEEPVE